MLRLILDTLAAWRARDRQAEQIHRDTIVYGLPPVCPRIDGELYDDCRANTQHMPMWLRAVERWRR